MKPTIRRPRTRPDEAGHSGSDFGGWDPRRYELFEYVAEMRNEQQMTRYRLPRNRRQGKRRMIP